MPIFDSQSAEKINHQIENLDWEQITQQMHDRGYSIIQNFLSDDFCDLIKSHYDTENLYRKTVNMQRYRFGLGEYKYFNYPLPNLIQLIRTQFYSHLVPIANAWFRVLKIDQQFPHIHAELLTQCQLDGQEKATVLILKYQQHGFNTLHQDLYGGVYFPIQVVIFLSQENVDFTGGEFVFNEQTPRAQSKAIVLKPNKGDVLIFTTQFRPVKGTHGYYRVNMKHGVSEIHSGERYTLGIIFHDAVS
ncbi:2OG-Fe(II) oxygenase [Acinetobacter wuhouensis]|uniref:Prolyl 4-hydroxylase subunit alpha n=1 Tax=Acinetobacter wuhouensis TaxID=1879050 RepID=A0A3G2T5Q8_9GAMM|nr:2OG-Fe(II) oxygenase [Acinetobacter wuhouensis]AYO55633.1 prolyl 4-hydroxylase subunit alpha [Acinetobacter wuhouensis]